MTLDSHTVLMVLRLTLSIVGLSFTLWSAWDAGRD
jgi:hypothetical protein